MIEEIDEEMICQILHRNFGFNLNAKFTDIFNCSILELDAREAFNFVQTVNGLSGRSYYFTEDRKPLIPYVVPELTLNRWSILDWFYQFPELFKGRKYLIPFRYNKTMEERKTKEQRILHKIKDAGLEPRNCIVTEISYYEGGSLEAFTEYVTSKLLINEGFLVENRIYFPDIEGVETIHTEGYPDFGAYKIPEIQDMLVRNHLIERGGFLHELALLRIFGKSHAVGFLKQSEPVFIVGEAKTAPISKKTFVEKEKYYSMGYFDRFLQITPHRRAFEKWYDYVEFEKDGTVKFIWSESKREFLWNKELKVERKKAIEKHIIRKVRDCLLQNLDFREFIELAQGLESKTIHNFYEGLNINQVIEFVIERIK